MTGTRGGGGAAARAVAAGAGSGGSGGAELSATRIPAIFRGWTTSLTDDATPIPDPLQNG